MKKNIFLLIGTLFFILINSLFCQQKEDQKFGINFNGYVKTDFIYDSRQTVNAREGHLLLYPANSQFDAYGKDINSKSNFNILSIQTRLTGKITSPNAFGAKTSGLIEGEFYGTADGDVNGLRLRHAYVKLDWEKTSLLIGQYWHPMFINESYPTVVSMNTGAPFTTFIRAPQIRLTQSFGSLILIGGLTSQRDFNSTGPVGFSSNYLRNSAIPDASFLFQMKSGENLVGLGFDYKTLVPKISTAKNFATNERVSSFSTIGYLKLNLSPLTFKLQGTYGQNLTDMLMLGGYAVKSIDTVTAIEHYTALNCFSIWSEFIIGKEIEVALFLGYSKNLGANSDLVGPIYARVNNIDYIYRISPRIQWTSGTTKFSTEIEYTSAAYGQVNLNNKGLVENSKRVPNLRILMAVYYFFQ